MAAPWIDTIKSDDLNNIYPCVHKDDLYPISIIQPDPTDGPWIAGGAVLSWYQGDAVGHGDIDVFCKSSQQADELIERIKNISSVQKAVDVGWTFDGGLDHLNMPVVKVVYESPNAITLRLNQYSDNLKSWTIQVIRKLFCNSIEEVINTFDITVCQIGTAGKDYIASSQTVQHINSKILHFNKPFHPDIVKRLVKYWAYGFEPHPNLITEIENLPEAKFDFKREEEDYENAFN